jgi:hypothetical protein
MSRGNGSLCERHLGLVLVVAWQVLGALYRPDGSHSIIGRYFVVGYWQFPFGKKLPRVLLARALDLCLPVCLDQVAIESPQMAGNQFSRPSKHQMRMGSSWALWVTFLMLTFQYVRIKARRPRQTLLSQLV